MTTRRNATQYTKHDHPVAEPRHLPLLWLLGPLLLSAAAVVAFAHRDLLQGDVGVWYALVTLAVVGAVLSGLYFRRRIQVAGDTLIIHSTMFSRRTTLSSMDLPRARVVDLAEHVELKPSSKSMGFGLPGFQSGHYRTRNGDKAFCLITDASRVLAIPLRSRTWVLISPRDPRQLLQDLQHLDASAPQQA